MKEAVIIILASVLVLNVGLALGLNCFTCSKPTDWDFYPECDANPIKPDAVECKSSPDPMCFRITATIKVDEQDVEYVARGCIGVSDSYKEQCFYANHSTYNVTALYCYCRTNECNGHGEIFKPNTSSKFSLAHFSFPVLGLALRHALALY